MRTIDSLAVMVAALFAVYGICLIHTGRKWLSLVMALLTVLLCADALRRWRRGPRFQRRREMRSAAARAKRALRILSLCPVVQVIETLSAVLCAVFPLRDTAARADGFLCREGEQSIWVQVIARHPEAGGVGAADIALAARRQREEGADACALCALCAAGKAPTDSRLRAVRVLDANALALLWARSGVPIPDTPKEPKSGSLRRLFTALVSPAPWRESIRLAGYGALLLFGWLVSRSPVLLVCACVQTARGIRGLTATKKAPVRLFG